MSIVHRYSSSQARLFSTLGIAGTTTEPAFKHAARMFNDSLRGKAVLDFGCGSGRSTMFVKALGAMVLVGVDTNPNMIKQARGMHKVRGVSFHKIFREIPFENNHFDAAFTAHALVESRTLDDMIASLSEIYRVLKPGSLLVIVTSNYKAIGHKYKVGYTKKRSGLKSGDAVETVIKSDPPFVINDTYWTEKDYRTAILQSGFKLARVSYPLARGKGWMDETKVAPNSVYKCIKPLVRNKD